MHTLHSLILEKATGFRSGVVLPAQNVNSFFADLPGIYNVSVGITGAIGESASGGIDRDPEQVCIKAIGESIERYTSSRATFSIFSEGELRELGKDIIPHERFGFFSEDQYMTPGFRWRKPDPITAYYGEMYSLRDNSSHFIPQELISLGSQTEDPIIPSTSTGLTSHPDRFQALLSALQEVLERDALIAYWQNSLPGREIQLKGEEIIKIHELGGEVFAFDLTQDWNPHPVIAVMGHIPIRGMKRFGLGTACRGTYEEALEKAYLEYHQGVMFSGIHRQYTPNIKLEDAQSVRTFDDHAVYYTCNPEEWNNIPLIKTRIQTGNTMKIGEYLQNKKDVSSQLKKLIDALKSHSIECYYRDITSIDVQQLGIHVVRVVCPGLCFIHGDEQEPFLGGNIKDVDLRWRDLINHTAFPNPYPHPLG